MGANYDESLSGNCLVLSLDIGLLKGRGSQQVGLLAGRLKMWRVRKTQDSEG
jgi:hypothetical protein